MIYIVELIKGVFLAFGVILGFIIPLAVFYSKRLSNYKVVELKIAFEEYLQEIKENENYEQIAEIENIILELKNGIVTESIDSFKIEKETMFAVKTQERESLYHIKNKYKIVGKEIKE